MFHSLPTLQSLRVLAESNRPGAIVLAEHVVDQHAAMFDNPGDRLTALDALARDLIRMGRVNVDLQPFLRQVDDYIELIQGWPKVA
ncbi:hypothetical protein [Methylobacterium sp. 22177]|uniref:hypothetical protein n=1 Tax=Methylobacterium sp. 22177 TaxID=3453885 RepID=UPI003F8471C8